MKYGAHGGKMLSARTISVSAVATITGPGKASIHRFIDFISPSPNDGSRSSVADTGD
jgi:hypothetical protein